MGGELGVVGWGKFAARAHRWSIPGDERQLTWSGNRRKGSQWCDRWIWTARWLDVRRSRKEDSNARRSGCEVKREGGCGCEAKREGGFGCEVKQI